MTKTMMLTAALLGAAGSSHPGLAAPQAPSCLHGPNASAEQQARRRDALGATRNINNMQANQPAAAQKRYLRHDELAASPFVQKSTSPAVTRLNLTPGEDILPGWQLTLDVAADTYWFMVKDKTDPCGFAFISNSSGVIYTAEPLR